MARCPKCKKLWTCGDPDEAMKRYYPPDDEDGNPIEVDHCGKCKCPDCRKDGDRMTIDEEYYGKKMTEEEKQDKRLEKLYIKLSETKGGDWFIMNRHEIDDIYEQMMEYAGAYNRETREFIDADDWSDLAHFVMKVFWKWYVDLIKKKLKITRYYERYYGRKDNKRVIGK